MADIPNDILNTVDRVIADLKGRADSIEEDAEAVLADAIARAILAERNLHYDARWANKAVQDVKDSFGEAMWAIRAERDRQVDEEGWTPEHDDQHTGDEMFRAAICYAFGSAKDWPWALDWFKLSDRRRDLVKAGALIVAEIERLDRMAVRNHPLTPQIGQMVKTMEGER